MLQILLTLFILTIVIFVPYLIGRKLAGESADVIDCWGVGAGMIFICTVCGGLLWVICAAVYEFAGYLIHTYHL